MQTSGGVLSLAEHVNSYELPVVCAVRLPDHYCSPRYHQITRPCSLACLQVPCKLHIHLLSDNDFTSPWSAGALGDDDNRLQFAERLVYR